VQRKAYVPGIAVLLAAVLAGCTGGSASGGAADDSKGSDSGTTAPAAQPGKYRTLPEACGAVSHDTLDSLLPGIKEIADAETRDTAYEGDATLTYDTDRRVGCRWKVESSTATDHLLVDFERVVSYDNAVSDDDKAQQLFAGKETAADLPEPAASSTESAQSGASTDPAAATEAYLDDTLSPASSTAQQRTVTVVFRTSNVIVTVEYAEQPTASAGTPDSKEMQDRARKLAQKLADTLGG
jgi:hypothetical protein